MTSESGSYAAWLEKEVSTYRLLTPVSLGTWVLSILYPSGTALPAGWVQAGLEPYKAQHLLSGFSVEEEKRSNHAPHINICSFFAFIRENYIRLHKLEDILSLIILLL